MMEAILRYVAEASVELSVGHQSNEQFSQDSKFCVVKEREREKRPWRSSLLILALVDQQNHDEGLM